MKENRKNLSQRIIAFLEKRKIKHRLKKEENDRKVMRWGKLITTALIMAGVFMIINSMILNAKKQMTTTQVALKSQLTVEQNNIHKIETRIGEVNTRAYIENRARIELQYINPGELRFEFENPAELDYETEAQKELRQQLEK